MLHYHGTPITPRSVLMELSGRNFCVRYGAHQQIEVCHKIGQSVMLDNGAFSFWKQGTPTDWQGYYEWVEPWLDYSTTWAVIPDVIDGDEDVNDRLVREWPFGQRGAPVWHMHESLERLEILCYFHERICIGSSADYAVLQTPRWHRRMEEIFNALCPTGRPPWVHMLRGMAFSPGPYPFASVDSTDIARNHNRPQNDAAEMAKRWDSMQPPPRWVPREQLSMSKAA